jgi:hypothetical protein
MPASLTGVRKEGAKIVDFCFGILLEYSSDKLANY